jgi:hypothetical protein
MNRSSTPATIPGNHGEKCKVNVLGALEFSNNVSGEPFPEVVG